MEEPAFGKAPVRGHVLKKCENTLFQKIQWPPRGCCILLFGGIANPAQQTALPRCIFAKWASRKQWAVFCKNTMGEVWSQKHCNLGCRFFESFKKSDSPRGCRIFGFHQGPQAFARQVLPRRIFRFERDRKNMWFKKNPIGDKLQKRWISKTKSGNKTALSQSLVLWPLFLPSNPHGYWVFDVGRTPKS